MPTPLPSKGTVLQTVEFADSLYSPLFVSSLYHILNHFSRGNLIFFWGNFFPQRGLLCSRHNPAFLQRTGSGSHLYSANLHTLRSDRGAEVLLALVGTRSLGRLALPFCTLIVSHFKGFVKRNFCFRRTFFTRCTLSPILVSLAGTSS